MMIQQQIVFVVTLHILIFLYGPGISREVNVLQIVIEIIIHLYLVMPKSNWFWQRMNRRRKLRGGETLFTTIKHGSICK